MRTESNPRAFWQPRLDAGYLYWEIAGKSCKVTLEPRPGWCDRGNFVANVHVTGAPWDLYIDEADGWPRYYFDQEVAFVELEMWLKRRHQWIHVPTKESP